MASHLFSGDFHAGVYSLPEVNFLPPNSLRTSTGAIRLSIQKNTIPAKKNEKRHRGFYRKARYENTGKLTNHPKLPSANHFPCPSGSPPSQQQVQKNSKIYTQLSNV